MFEGLSTVVAPVAAWVGSDSPVSATVNSTEVLVRFRATSPVQRTSVNGFKLHYIFHRTFYVSSEVMVGRDYKDGTFDQPFATIAEAVRRAQSGDTIRVYPGTHAT